MTDAMETAVVEAAETDTLSPEEQAFFESGGETEIKAAEPETAKEPEKAGDEPEKPQMVPHGALHAEREKRKASEAEAQSIRERMAVLEDRWNTLLKAQEPEKPAGPPDPNEDIFAFAQWQKQQLEALQAKVSEREKQETEAQQAARAEAEAQDFWNGSVQEFASQTPDFGEAAQYLATVRTAQLKAMGYNDGQVNAQINAEVLATVQQARQAGTNPAEMIYNYAKATGYQQKQAGTPEMPEQLANVAKAQEAAKTIGKAPGSPGGGELTAQAIDAMSDAEFEQWIAKNGSKFRHIMGG